MSNVASFNWYWKMKKPENEKPENDHFFIYDMASKKNLMWPQHESTKQSSASKLK